MLKTGIIALVLGGSVVGLPTMVEARVTTRFVSPERYTDAENRFGSGVSLRVTVEEIRRIIEIEAQRSLKPGEGLTIDVLDIDLAGMEQPGANIPYGLRVVRDITPPRFRLRYALSERGRIVVSGEETVTDQNFLMRSSRGSSGTFSHERELLRDWFRERIVERRPARS